MVTYSKQIRVPLRIDATREVGYTSEVSEWEFLFIHGSIERIIWSFTSLLT
jgi:hypothetical protein